MRKSTLVATLDTQVQELRLEDRRRSFVNDLKHIITTLGQIPDSPPVDFGVGDRDRLREIADEIAESIERRIDDGGDDDATKQHLASTIYEVRRRTEIVEGWFAHAFPNA